MTVAILSFLYTGEVEDEVSYHNSYMWAYLRLFEVAKLHEIPDMQAYAKLKLMEDEDTISWGLYRPSNQYIDLVYQELDGTANDSRDLQKLLLAKHAVTTIKYFIKKDTKKNELKGFIKKYPDLGIDLLAGLSERVGEADPGMMADFLKALVDEEELSD